MMSEREIKISIIENAEIMAKILFNGKDVELRKDENNVKILSINKKIVRR